MANDLSGRVDTLETQVAQIFQLLLNKMDLQDANSLQTLISQNLDDFGNILASLSGRTDTLENLYSNLVYQFNAHVNMSTGQGVHGHPLSG